MATYLYPTLRELRDLGPELVAEQMQGDALFDLMPVRSVNAAHLQWMVEDDDFGLQQLRGIDGAPLMVRPLGKNSYLSQPGYFGEFETVTETELTERGGSVVGEATVSVEDLVATRFRQLIGREYNRIRQIGWTLLTTGTFSVSSKGGTVTYGDTFDLATQAGSDWGTAATATPLADLRTLQASGGEYGVNYGSAAKAIMNRATANKLLNNTNAADLGGRRTLGGGTINSIAETNRIVLGEDLPELVIYDKGYKDEAGDYTRFIPDDKVVVFGTRSDNDVIAEYRMTRNLNNPGGTPGSYEFVKDYAQGINAPKEVPPRIEIHRGHNGGPVIFRPNAITVLSV